MNILGATLVSIASLAAGGIVGFVFGFSLASHADVLRGVRPATTNRLVLFLARPTSELRLLESLLLLVLIGAWLVVFFALCAVPAVVAGRFLDDAELLTPVGYILFMSAGWLGRRFGKHVWWAMS
jgi:hypothetical protein